MLATGWGAIMLGYTKLTIPAGGLAAVLAYISFISAYIAFIPFLTSFLAFFASLAPFLSESDAEESFFLDFLQQQPLTQQQMLQIRMPMKIKKPITPQTTAPIIAASYTASLQLSQTPSVHMRESHCKSELQATPLHLLELSKA